MTPDEVRAIALANAGFLADAADARCEAIPALDPGGEMMWRGTISSIKRLRRLGLAGEQPLLEAYFEAHVELLLAIVARTR